MLSAPRSASCTMCSSRVRIGSDDRQDDIGDMAVIDHARTEATLRRLGLTYLDKDDALLDAHFGYLAECGFMPPPAEPTPRANDARRDAEPEPAW
ncbi:hypothetical protein [Burkholderia sp. MSMB1078WGS]|uniref:hypothetical protein n=1 Tax=Burkholderia sp. MSMB1078WGS TaxID=1637900 RepID=UPI00211D78A5|nr:hypothetical protein [Burkholderia sp. MSMB1078WGS]